MSALDRRLPHPGVALHVQIQEQKDKKYWQRVSRGTPAGVDADSEASLNTFVSIMRDADSLARAMVLDGRGASGRQPQEQPLCVPVPLRPSPFACCPPLALQGLCWHHRALWVRPCPRLFLATAAPRSRRWPRTRRRQEAAARLGAWEGLGGEEDPELAVLRVGRLAPVLWVPLPPGPRHPPLRSTCCRRPWGWAYVCTACTAG